MSIITAAVSRAVDGLLLPFSGLPPLVGIVVMSLLAAIVMLLTMRVASDQERLVAVRRSLKACVYELRLFRDDPLAVGRILAEGVGLNLTALRLALVPVLWLLVPFGLLAAQLQSIYGYAGLEPGRPAILKVQLREGGERPRLHISPPGVRVETPAIWIPSLREAAWRISGDRPGEYDATIEHNGEATVKRITVAAASRVRRSPVRSRSIYDQLLYPSEPSLPASSSIESITVAYPEASLRLFGQEVHWSVVFVGVSFAFVFALRRRFGVTL